MLFKFNNLSNYMYIENYRDRVLFFHGIKNSRILRTFAIGIIFGALSTGALFLITAHPAAWMLKSAVGGGFSVGLIIGIVIQGKKGRQMMSFEITAIIRLCKKKNYDEITNIGDSKIFLGAIPNRLKKNGDKLFWESGESVKAVLSVNEPWEREPLGLSIPYKYNWDVFVAHKLLDVEDHALLTNEQLNEAALFIHQRIEAGENVYVHCRAGNGRSATALAAYLIRYQGYTVEEARALIAEKRPSSTIDKKVVRLKEWMLLAIPLNELNEKQKLEGAHFIADRALPYEEGIIGNDQITDLAYALYIRKYNESIFKPETCEEVINFVKERRQNCELKADHPLLVALVNDLLNKAGHKWADSIQNMGVMNPFGCEELSDLALALWLMKYGDTSIEKSVNLVKENRPESKLSIDHYMLQAFKHI